MGAAPQRIRVARIIGRLNVGGPAIHTTLLTEQLDPERYETLLISGQEDPGEGNYLELRGGDVPGLVRVPAMRRAIHPLRDAAALAGITRLLRTFRPHIVHTHTAKAGTLGRLAALATPAPVVVHTFHGHVLEGYFSPARARVFVEIERRLARRTDAVLAVSPAVRAELLARGIGTAAIVRVLPLGLPLERFREGARPNDTLALRAELGLPPATVLIGIVARLVPIKAHETFLYAAADLARDRRELHFAVVGDGERRAELEGLTAALGLTGRVSFLGWRADLDRIYRALDVVALTSRNEGSPVALIEAMAAGRAVVATRVGGVPDLVEHGRSGLLVDPDAPPALATALARLLDRPDLRSEFALAGQRHVLERHGSQRLLDDIDRLYCELLRAKLGAEALAALMPVPPLRRAAAAGAGA